jgi:hypothetical protein
VLVVSGVTAFTKLDSAHRFEGWYRRRGVLMSARGFCSVEQAREIVSGCLSLRTVSGNLRC